MAEFQLSKLADPTYYEENKLRPHSDHFFFADEEEARTGKSSFIRSLNGLWYFSYARNPEQVIPNFQSAKYDCRTWAQIRVPAHIQLEGYDTPQYVNVQYPWDGRENALPGTLPEKFNPVACYVKYFQATTEEPLFVSFQGAESALALWLNGQFVGYSEGSFLPAEFELTRFLTEGENKLAVMVMKWSASSWAEDQDFFRFSGLFRDVFLYTIPRAHIRDLNVRGEVSEDLQKGKMHLYVDAMGLAVKENAVAKIELVALGRTDLGEPRTDMPSFALKPQFEQVISQKEMPLSDLCGEEKALCMEVEQPLLWSAEEPNLYEVRIGIFTMDGTQLEFVPQRFGFRRFEIKNQLMLLNGKRIVFKGVNRHEFGSVMGRVPRLQDLWQDLVTMKQHNINAIRTCHYPNHSPIYGLCDALGIYMVDETDLETHGIWTAILYGGGRFGMDFALPGDRPDWKAMVLDRAERMYERDKNHPAILIWSCGNESFGGSNIQAMTDYFHKMDPSRIVQYEGIMHDRRYPDTSDIESQMYTSVEGIKDWLAHDRSKPMVMIEYTHAMGNSCGGMHKYTDLTDTEPMYQGGFIWDYVDQSLDAKDANGVSYQAYGGDFDDRPSDYNFSGNGIVYGGSRLPSPKMQDVKYNYRNIAVTITGAEDAQKGLVLSAKVQNKNLFVNTDCFDAVLLIHRNGKLYDSVKMNLSVPAGEKMQFDAFYVLDAWKKAKQSQDYTGSNRDACSAGNATAATSLQLQDEFTALLSFRLKEDTCWAKAGHEIAFGQAAFAARKLQMPIRKAPNAGQHGMICTYGGSNFGVKGTDFEVLFAYDRGLTSYRYGGVELLKDTVRPNFWRAPIDNDFGNNMMARYGQWKLGSLYLRKAPTDPEKLPNNPMLVEREDCVAVTYVYRMPTKPEADVSVTYLVYADGTLQLQLDYEPVEGMGDMPEFGFLLKLRSDYDQLTWYGNGPAETYVDRQEGAKLGLYHSTASEEMAAYMVPQECGNHTQVRYAKVTDKKGRGLLLAGEGMHFSALPYTPHELENAQHPNELPPVNYTIVRIALSQMGVGGDDSWGARPHPEYLIDVSGPVHFSCCMKGI